jgi:cobalt/nickel transport system ATP-binding protein
MKPIIEIRDLSFTYENGVEALCGVNLTIGERETVVFIGPNGAGKSTLLLMMRGLLGKLNGRIRIAGERLDHPGQVEALAGKIGLVFQNPEDQLFCPTVFDDVAFGPLNMGVAPERVRERVTAALRAVGLAGYEGRVPHQLSGGEKRRVSLATIYAMEPDILLLDEPTSHLDPHARQEVIALIQQFPGTRVIATHDFELILKVAERVVLFHRGRIKADGCPIEVLTDEALLKENGMEMPLVVRYLMALHSGDEEALHEHEHEHIYHYHTQEGKKTVRSVRHSHIHSHDHDVDHTHGHETES